NFNLRQLAARIKEGVRAAGGTPMEFNTVAVSDGITMGTEGMKASLVSRELIADSMELMSRAYFFDALVTVVACDKTIPAGALARGPAVVSSQPRRWRWRWSFAVCRQWEPLACPQKTRARAMSGVAAASW